MKQYFDPQFLLSQATLLWEKFSLAIFRVDTGMEAIAIFISLLLAFLVSRPLVGVFEKIRRKIKKRNQFQEKLLDLVPRLIKPILAIFCCPFAQRFLHIRKLTPFLWISAPVFSLPGS